MSSDACSSLSIHSAIQQQGINPDADLLLGSSRATWQDFCEVVVAWNARFAAVPFLAEADAGNNLLTLAAFLGNAAQESADFVACAEYINPCQGVCSGGNAEDYRDALWGKCYQVPVPTTDNFDKTGSLPADACGTSGQVTCVDWDGRPHSGDSCWYGKGALQLTWNCNYAKANTLLREIGLEIDICADPDSICNDGQTFWAGSLAYWMMSVSPYYLQDHRIDTAMNCIKSSCSAPYPGTWTGSGAAVRRANYEGYLSKLTGGTAPDPASPTPSPSPPPPSGSPLPPPPVPPPGCSDACASPLPAAPPPPSPSPPCAGCADDLEQAGSAIGAIGKRFIKIGVAAIAAFATILLAAVAWWLLWQRARLRRRGGGNKNSTLESDDAVTVPSGEGVEAGAGMTFSGKV